MKGLLVIAALSLLIVAVAQGEPVRGQNQIPYQLMNRLNKKARNLLSKVFTIKLDFAKSRGVNPYSFTASHSQLPVKHRSCGNLATALRMFQALFDETQSMQLSESHVTRNDPTDIYVHKFRKLEFKLRELVSILRKLSKAMGFKSSQIAPYSVGLKHNSKYPANGKELAKDEVNLMNFLNLESIEKCLESFNRRPSKN